MYYFEENQVKDIFNKMSVSFPGSEIVFDVSSSFGVKTANKKVIQNSELDEKSFLKWAESCIRIPNGTIK